MLDERRFGKTSEGSGSDPIRVLYWKVWRKPWKISVRISSVPSKTLTEHHSDNKSRVLPLDYPVPSVHLNLITLAIYYVILSTILLVSNSAYRLRYIQFASAFRSRWDSKGVTLALNWLSTTPWRRMADWMYRSTYSWTSALVGGERLASRPGRFTPGTHWIGSWVGPRTWRKR
jgi:hypothetical protein